MLSKNNENYLKASDEGGGGVGGGGGIDSPIRAGSSVDSDVTDDDEPSQKKIKNNDTVNQQQQQQHNIRSGAGGGDGGGGITPTGTILSKENTFIYHPTTFLPFFNGYSFPPPLSDFYYPSPTPFSRELFLQHATQFSQFFNRPILPTITNNATNANPLPAVPIVPPPKKGGFDVSDLLAKP